MLCPGNIIKPAISSSTLLKSHCAVLYSERIECFTWTFHVDDNIQEFTCMLNEPYNSSELADFYGYVCAMAQLPLENLQWHENPPFFHVFSTAVFGSISLQKLGEVLADQLKLHWESKIGRRVTPHRQQRGSCSP